MAGLRVGGGRRWVPTPFVWLCILLHLAVAIALISAPAAWRLWVGVLLCNHLLLFCVSLWPRSALLGPNLMHVPPGPHRHASIIVLTFDDGPDPDVTPAVLDLLDRYDAKASFFCIGERAARFPRLVTEIVRRGHSVENHSHRHATGFAFRPPGALRREVERAQNTLTRIAGTAPVFFRAPFGIRGPLLDCVLAALPLRYVSWTRRGFDTVARHPEAVLRRITRDLAAGDILVLHDTAASLTAAGRPLVLDVLPALLQRIDAAGLRALSLPLAMTENPVRESAHEPVIAISLSRQIRRMHNPTPAEHGEM